MQASLTKIRQRRHQRFERRSVLSAKKKYLVHSFLPPCPHPSSVVALPLPPTCTPVYVLLFSSFAASKRASRSPPTSAADSSGLAAFCAFSGFSSGRKEPVFGGNLTNLPARPYTRNT